MADRNHKKEYYDAICDLESCFDDDSDESTILKMLSFQRASDSFRAHFETDNLCKNDVPLSLTRITASEDYQLVWLHDGQPLKAHIREDAEEKLRIVFVNIHCFTSMDLCLHFLRELDADCVRLREGPWNHRPEKLPMVLRNWNGVSSSKEGEKWPGWLNLYGSRPKDGRDPTHPLFSRETWLGQKTWFLSHFVFEIFQRETAIGLIDVLYQTIAQTQLYKTVCRVRVINPSEKHSKSKQRTASTILTVFHTPFFALFASPWRHFSRT